MKVIVSIVLLLALLGSALAMNGDSTRGIVSVIDGDTIELHGKRIRLHGVDAPEGKQTYTRDGVEWRCGQQAAFALSDHIGNQSVECIEKDIDRYKRIVAECFVGDVSINAWLVRNGWAIAYRKYSKQYIEDEDIAREQKAGIWGGEFVEPWEYRKRK